MKKIRPQKWTISTLTEIGRETNLKSRSEKKLQDDFQLQPIAQWHPNGHEITYCLSATFCKHKGTFL